MNFKNFLFSCAAIIMSVIFVALSYASVQRVILGDVSGRVDLISDGAESGRKAKRGMRLYEGDVLKTYKNSRAEIFFKGSGMVTVNEESIFKVEKAIAMGDYRETINFVQKGEIEARIRHLSKSKSKFLVKTPVAVAAVRGTTYIVKVTQNGASTVHVIDGMVELTSLLSGLGVTIGEGQSSTAGPNGHLDKPSADVNFEFIDLNLDNGAFNMSPTVGSSVPSARNAEASAVEKKAYGDGNSSEESSGHSGFAVVG